MPPIQTAWPDRMEAYALGRRVNMEEWNTITGVAAEAIGCAQPAYQGSTDQGIIAGADFAATGAGSAAAGNVGTGTITASPSITAGAKQGRYRIALTATSATAPYLVYDPDGILVGHGVVATANTTIPGITTFTISNAGTMTAGDTYYIDVTLTENDNFLGITETSPNVEFDVDENGIYPVGANVPVCESGVIAVMAGGTCNRKTPVYWISSTKTYTSTATGNIKIPNAEFDATKSSGSLVPVRLRRIPPAA